jgi:hypothetical protein
MLGCRPSGRRHRRHRLDALSFPGHDQSHAIIPKWASTILMANDAHKSLDIGLKSRFTAICRLEIHPSPR